MSAGEIVPQQESRHANEILSQTENGNVILPSVTDISEIDDHHDSSGSSPVLVSSIPPTVMNAKHMGQQQQHRSPRPSPLSKRRVRAHSFAGTNHHPIFPQSGLATGNDSRDRRSSLPTSLLRNQSDRQVLLSDALARAKSRDALRVNDSMVYLDGPQVYTCAQCRTHITSHDDIISKSFHGRHGRAYLFDQCVNVSIGPSEDRRLITGMHTVSDLFCKRCKTLVGWTYLKAYESSQKYKEGKYIIEKINLHLEESDYYSVAPPAGERTDRWRRRSMSWGDDTQTVGYNRTSNASGGDSSAIVFEYRPSAS